MHRLSFIRPVCALLLVTVLTGCAAPAMENRGAPASGNTAPTQPASRPTVAGQAAETTETRQAQTTSAVESTSPAGETAATAPLPEQTGGRYEIPPFADAVFNPDAAVSSEGVEADFSGLNKGYIALRATSSKRLKFQIILGDVKYNYDLPGDGTPTVFPLSLGSGSYTFRVMENASGSKYLCLWKQGRNVQLDDEFQPFLRPSQMSAYTEDSDCVRQAGSLAAQCDTDAEVASAVYEYLSANIRYDYDKAATVQSGYLPDPDRTLAEKTGICFDYASLAAAMLRSVGIPCKLIVGYVRNGGNEVYHAWNSFYLKEQGWVTVQIQAKPNIWQRVDITFAAAGVDAASLTNDALYTTRYTY